MNIESHHNPVKCIFMDVMLPNQLIPEHMHEGAYFRPPTFPFHDDKVFRLLLSMSVVMRWEERAENLCRVWSWTLKRTAHVAELKVKGRRRIFLCYEKFVEKVRCKSAWVIYDSNQTDAVSMTELWMRFLSLSASSSFPYRINLQLKIAQTNWSHGEEASAADGMWQTPQSHMRPTRLHKQICAENK